LTDLTESGYSKRMATTETTLQKPGVILQAERELAYNLAKIGPSEAVDRFLRSYGKVRVRAAMSFRLMIYFRFLKARGLSQLSPDELIIDNLRCIAKAEPEDVAGVDYPELEPVDLGKFFGTKWGRDGQRIRLGPNSNVEISRAEAATVFSHLNFIKNSGDLKNWVLVIDEAHRFSSDANLRALLIEARKFVGKMLIVTTDWRVYEGIAKVFKPKRF
jgi:hypothetical protein